MTISEKGELFLISEEGLKLKSYQDSKGVWTIGIGSTRYKNGEAVKKGDVLTKEQAFDLMHWEISNKSKVIDDLLGPKTILNQNQYDVLISFTYNEGIGALASSTLLKKIKVNPNDPLIKNEFPKWNKIRIDGKLQISKGLIARRKRELNYYFTSVM